ncbi:MAG: response regulator [Lachnospiraceae bacterium]|nr:response regulator [Lachnospiraceae bacterium]
MQSIKTIDKGSNSQVLIVDDMEINVDILAEIISEMGFVPLSAYSVEEAFGFIKTSLPQLILLDVSMPQMDGYEFCSILKRNPVTRDIPVIFISALDTIQDKLRGLELGAVDFITKPFEATEVTMRVRNQLESRRMKLEMEGFNRRLHKMLSAQMEKLDNEKKAVICALAEMINIRMGVPGDHLKRVKYNSRVLAQSLQLAPDFLELVTEEFIENIGDAAMLHNLGYLWDSEKEGHCVTGVKILNSLLEYEEASIFKELAIDVITFHHDRYEANDKIPLAARITQIINDFDHQTYLFRANFTDEEIRKKAIDALLPDSGIIYDPQIMEIFTKIQRQLHIDK